MALLLKPLRCPHCQEPIDKALLRRSGRLQAFLKRKSFGCPHCEQAVLFPEKADTTVSLGIFVAVILAPLFHLWEVNFIDSRHLFGVGVVVIAAGLFTQKLVKA
ncbi:hypothetical protein HBA55_20595 [Pseudomaricurvus alkylphenolicus]|uniref:hypothetical protein n=1 Tax=Pseudomaricurvus alkylphenolicus TaxID=1306991 RepID=UPI0014249C80|nr:hypothetical protein [Pseudomaricurvus alkylphenolicus]NIB42016.1 hypothetical protein [Pseudomaricurvus alkylphenolicus]